MNETKNKNFNFLVKVKFRIKWISDTMSYRNPNTSQGSDDLHGLKESISEADCIKWKFSLLNKKLIYILIF